MKRFSTVVVTLILVAVLAAPILAGECEEKCCGFKFNGFFKTDLIYDNHRVSPGDFALYVPEYEGDESNEFFLGVRETRLGFDFWWKEEDYKTKAYFEFDLQNAGGGVNKAAPMLRHAYFKFGKCNWTLLAGQTWDIISPLNPATANYSVLWYQGNIGYRRPQIRFTTWTEAGDAGKVKFDVGVTRNLGGDLDDNGIDDGVDAGTPAFQGRLGYAGKLGEEGKFLLGVSGHYGNEKYDDDGETLKSWSFNGDLALVLNKKISLKGEFFTGENLGQYLGGIGQRVTPGLEPLGTTGGWAMLSLSPKKKVTLNLGYGLDDPEEDWEVPTDDTGKMMDKNSEFFGNIFLTVNKNVTAIFELAYMKTEYLSKTDVGGTVTEESTDFDDMRFQFSLKCGIN